MNLLQMAPLCDSSGKIRYFIGAQIDVSGLAMEGAQMESLQEFRAQKDNPDAGSSDSKESKSEFQELGELFSPRELQNVREHGGNLFQPTVSEDPSHRLFLQDSDREDEFQAAHQAPVPELSPGNSLIGVYKNVRPHFPFPILLIPTRTQLTSLPTYLVPPRPPLPIPPHPLHIPLPPNTRHPANLLLKPNRRLRTQAREHPQRHDVRPRRHSAHQVGDEIQPWAGPVSLDPLHAVDGA